MSINERVEKIIYSKNLLTGVCVVSFLESTVIPIPLEAVLIPLMQKRRDRLWMLAAVTTIGCLIGAVFGYAVGYFLFEAAQNFIFTHVTTQAEFESFQQNIQENGFWFVFSTGITPVPLQLAMLVAGVTKYSFTLYMLAITTGRIIRYYFIAGLVYYFGDRTEALVKKYKWQAVIGVSAVVLVFIASRFIFAN